MANQMNELDERLALLDAEAHAILTAATQTVQLPVETEQWWPYLVELFGDENSIFTRLRIDRGVFEEALALVVNVSGERRGRRSVIRSNRERLLFLMIFMSKGVEVLEQLVTRFFRTREHIVERAKAFAAMFEPNIVGGAVRYFDEFHPALPGTCGGLYSLPHPETKAAV